MWLRICMKISHHPEFCTTDPNLLFIINVFVVWCCVIYHVSLMLQSHCVVINGGSLLKGVGFHYPEMFHKNGITFSTFKLIVITRHLPPAYVVRGKVLFPQVSVCSHLCVWGGGALSSWQWGTSFPGLDGGGYPFPRSVWGVPPSQIQVGGIPAGGTSKQG